MKEKYSIKKYGKYFHITSKYDKRIRETFWEYLEKISRLSEEEFNKIDINNTICELRNDIVNIVGEIYQDLSMELKYKLPIKSVRRKEVGYVDIYLKPKYKPCIICGEKRAIDRCHIIPRVDGGSNLESNVIYLCPTHHFLFDQSMLTEEEFNKIDISEKAGDSKEFFNKKHKTGHQMYWRYKLNKFMGCICGSLEFGYGAVEELDCVVPCFICKNCKKVYSFYNHPLYKELKIDLYKFEFRDKEPHEKERIINDAMKTIREALKMKNLEVIG